MHTGITQAITLAINHKILPSRGEGLIGLPLLTTECPLAFMHYDSMVFSALA